MARKKTTRRPAARKTAHKPARKAVRKTRNSARKAPKTARATRRAQRMKKAAFRQTLRPTGLSRSKSLTPKDINALWDQLQSEERSEKVWREMTAPARPTNAREEAWTAVEEELVGEAQGRDQSIKRWKYFAK